MKSFVRLPLLAHFLFFAIAPGARAAVDYATPYAFTTLAGISSIGSADGNGTAARFYSPRDIATDSAGNVFIADEGNHTIRKITPAGVVSTFAGTAGVPGSADGTGAAARFDSPQGIVADSSDNLFITDTGNHTIRKVTPAGIVTTLAGLAGVTGSTDGAGSVARFNIPRRIALDATGNLYLTETGNGAIRKVTPAGTVSTLARASFSEISGWGPVSYGAIAVDTAGNVYVSRFVYADTLTHAPVWSDNFSYFGGAVTRYAPDGTSTDLWTTSVTRYFDGRISNSSVSALAFNPAGQLIATIGHKIVRVSPLTSPPTTIAGDGTAGGSDGLSGSAKFGFPLALAYDRTGTLYIADTGNNTVRKLSPTSTVTTIAGLALENATSTVDGAGTLARLANPAGLAVDATGNVYVADTAGHCIRKITPAGVVTTLAGSPGVSGYVDGTGSTARFNGPTGLAFKANGALYVTDTNNHTVRLVAPTGETTTIAGLATASGWNDGQGINARFIFPRGIALDAAGNLYVISASTVRKIDTSNNVTTFAGFNSEVGYFDAFGTSARFSVPYGITVGPDGSVYVTEAPDGPTIARIRKISPAGDVSTVTGAEHGYADGNAASARFHNPYSIAADSTGNLFVTDGYNQAIRKISPQGAVSTVAGLGDAPGSTDGVGSTARFYYPQGIAVDSGGNLYVASGTTIRKGQLAVLPVITTQPQGVSLAAGGTAQFSVVATGTPAPTFQWFHNGNALSGATGNSLSLAGVQAANMGNYAVVVTNPLGSVTSNAASLTVTGSGGGNPPPSGGSSGGGGGAPSAWFLVALAALAVGRKLARRSAGG